MAPEDGLLSQEEIDALIARFNRPASPASPAPPAEPEDGPLGSPPPAAPAAPASAAGPPLPPHLRGLSVVLVAELGTATVTLGEILSWKPDDLVVLDRLVSQPLRLTVQGVEVAHGRAVTWEGGRLGVRIEGIARPR